MPKYPDFPEDEYQQRYAKARSLMKEQNLDALLITEELNYIYFTGHRSQQNPVDKVRPYIFILPREDDGVIITMPFELDQVVEATWLTDVRMAGMMDRVDPVVAVLKEKGLSKARIGAELGREQYLGISYNEFEAIRKGVSQASFVDAAQIFLTLRGTKSPREIEYIRKAGAITATAMAETIQNIRAGMTEIEVMRVLRTLMAQHGGERENFMDVVAGVGPKGGMVQVATERKLQPGDTLVLDTGVEYHGYNTDVARSAFVGEPPAAVIDHYNFMLKVQKRSLEQLRVGSTPQKVIAACLEACAESGLVPAVAGRIGHGVGLDATEYPSLIRTEEIVFEAGMVFTCNPNFFREFGFLNAEDTWAIKETGLDLLSAPMAPAELPIIPVH